MKKWLLVFGILCMTRTLFPSVDSIAVDVALDSIQITHLYAERNCGSIFIYDVTITDNYIRIFENDTSTAYMRCMCHFDLSVTLGSLPAGDYFVEVFGTSVLNKDTTFCGSAHFTIPAAKLVEQTNSGCLRNGKSFTDSFDGQTIDLPLIDETDSGCLPETITNYSDHYSWSDGLYLSWGVNAVPTDFNPLWKAWIESDTLFVTAEDSLSTSVTSCSKRFSASFGSIPPGKYILNFREDEFGLSTVILGSTVSITTVGNMMTLRWDIADLNCALQPEWKGWLSADTFYVTMTDTGMQVDCVCPFELSATFGPFAKGTYILAFDACLPDYPTFQIGSEKATKEWRVISSHQSECYNLSSTAPNLTRPESFAIRGVFPNPFNSFTTIRFDLPEKQFVTVSIFDLNGNLVETLLRDELTAGNYSVRWDAKNRASGIYFVKLAGESTARMSKVVLVK